VTRFFGLDLLDNRYPPLHGLRFLAILSVVQFHVTSILVIERRMPLDPEWTAWSLRIFFGMDLFFVLSGFLIGSILLHSLAKTGVRGIGRFYLRRVFRTFPLYYLVLTTLVLIGPMGPGQWKNLWSEYTYLSNFTSLAPGQIVMVWGWSLSLEEQFYLVVPLLFLLLQRLRTDRARIGLLVILFFVALALRLWVYFRYAPWEYAVLRGALYFRTPTRFDTLIAGVLLAYVHHRWKEPLDAWMAVPRHRGVLGVGALACLWLLLEPGMFGEEHVNLVHVFLWGTVTSVMYLAMGLLLLHPPAGTDGGAVQRFLGAPLFRKLATLGYGVYLVHIPLCDHFIVPLASTLYARGWSPPLVWATCFTGLMVITLALAYALHLLVEKPALWLRDRVAA
jgi:peptidoglycan/LPS O-acetylase OafA/YrhL